MNRIVLDTNVLWSVDALNTLMGMPLEVVVPSIVLAERVRQIRARGQDVGIFLERIRLLDWTIEALGREQALRYSTEITQDDKWRALARDAFIAGHVRQGDVLWTSNVKDFVAIGVPERQIQRV